MRHILITQKIIDKQGISSVQRLWIYEEEI